MGKMLLVTSYFVITPSLLICCCILLLALSLKGISFGKSPFFNTSTVAYAALPNEHNEIVQTITQEDARPEIVRQFFARYHSPLEPYAADVIKAADEYKLDFRLIPAIAMQESNLCLKAPKNTHNCWGFGIYGGKVKIFGSYTEAINTVTKSLAKDYKTSGLESPEEIMKRYSPSSDGSWAFSVNHFMTQLSLNQ